jgi:branched-subunit amino acid transport protein
MDYAILILAMSLVTFSARYSMIAILGRWKVPPDVTRALAYVPVAAFAAIAAPELVLRDGSFAIGLANPRLVAGIAAIVVALWSRNVLLTLAAGMGVMWFMQVLVT